MDIFGLWPFIRKLLLLSLLTASDKTAKASSLSAPGLGEPVHGLLDLGSLLTRATPASAPANQVIVERYVTGRLIRAWCKSSSGTVRANSCRTEVSTTKNYLHSDMQLR